MSDPANEQWMAQLQQQPDLPADPVAQQIAMEAAQQAAAQHAAQQAAAQQEAARQTAAPNVTALITDLYNKLRQQDDLLQALSARASASEIPSAAMASGPRLTVRLAEPRRYSGRPSEDPEEYLNSVEQYFLLGGIHGEHQRIMLAGQYLEDSARDWYLIAFEASQLVSHPGAYTWTGFKDALRKRFVTRDPADTARAKLFRLHQGHMSLRDYTLQFQHLATRAGTITDADLKVLYLDRMDPAIATQVGLRFPATLTDAITMAEQTLVHSRPITEHRRPPPWQPSRPHRSGATPMELGAVVRRASDGQKKTPTRTLQDLGVTRDQYEARKRTGACLRCGAQGHLIKDCPQMNSGPGGGTRLRSHQTR